MAPFKFTKKILNGETLDIYNHGEMQRDFTYIDDLIQSVRLLMDQPPDRTESVIRNDSKSDVAPFRLVNIGNSEPVSLMDFITCIEKITGIEARKNYLPMQDGDVPATWADTYLLEALVQYKPNTNLSDGLTSFINWYASYRTLLK